MLSAINEEPELDSENSSSSTDDRRRPQRDSIDDDTDFTLKGEDAVDYSDINELADESPVHSDDLGDEEIDLEDAIPANKLIGGLREGNETDDMELM